MNNELLTFAAVGAIGYAFYRANRDKTFTEHVADKFDEVGGYINQNIIPGNASLGTFTYDVVEGAKDLANDNPIYDGVNGFLRGIGIIDEQDTLGTSIYNTADKYGWTN